MKAKELKEYYESCEEYYITLEKKGMEHYKKYIDFLMPENGNKVLDVGCGTGQVVHYLSKLGFEAYGVDISPIAIQKARQNRPGIFKTMEDDKIPFPDNFFDSVGCYDVLEHTLHPSELIDEMIRVLKPNGKIVIACPNFLRVIGLKAHHHRTRGITNKIRNFIILIKKVFLYIAFQKEVKWIFMEPMLDPSLGPDHDAVCVTNPIDIIHYLRKKGCVIKYHSSLLRYHPFQFINKLGEMPGIRTLTGGVFIVAKKISKSDKKFNKK